MKTPPRNLANLLLRKHQQSKTRMSLNVKPEIVNVCSKKHNGSQAWAWEPESGAETTVTILVDGREGRRDDGAGLSWKEMRVRRQGLRGWRLRGRVRDGDKLSFPPHGPLCVFLAGIIIW
jgi:hypothetical protein